MNTDQKGMNRTSAEKSLYEELRAYEEEGCQLYLNGRPSYAGQVVNAYFREHSSYMRDLVSEDGSVIRGINFVRVKQ